MIHDKAISMMVQQCGIPMSSWLAYFPDDNTITGDFLAYSPLNTGIFNTTGDIVGMSATDIPDYTIIVKVANTGSYDGVIFSNYSTGAINSGLSFGITRGNRLFCEYYAETGPVAVVTSFAVPDTSVVSLCKAGDSFSIGYFNSNKRELVSESYAFSNGAIAYSNKWSIGGAPSAPTQIKNGSFSGYLTELSIFSGCLRPSEIEKIMEGSIITGDTAETTGYSYTSIRNLQPKSIAVFDPVDTGDYLTFIRHTGTSLSSFNYDAIYDSVIGQFDNSAVGVSNPILFKNGILFHNGGYTNSGSYLQSFIPIRDYFISGDNFYSDNLLAQDRVIFDSGVSTGIIYDTFSHNGSSVQSISGRTSNSEIFFNGLLLSNNDYSISGSYYVFETGNSLYDGCSGVLSVQYFDYQLTAVSKSFGKLLDYSSFIPSQSCLYVNGVRQNLSEDYIEIGTRDFRNKTGIFADYTQSTFTNNFSFTT